MKILILNGPNLNLLGTRQPEHYGNTTLVDIDERLSRLGQELGVRVESYQSNAEHELVDRIHLAVEHDVQFIIINPAAFTHSSVAIRDALSGVSIPFIEVHLSNIHAREEFRRHSYLSDIAVGVISGLGAVGYEMALRAAVLRLQEK